MTLENLMAKVAQTAPNFNGGKPISQKVLDAMRLVDRADYIPGLKVDHQTYRSILGMVQVDRILGRDDDPHLIAELRKYGNITATGELRFEDLFPINPYVDHPLDIGYQQTCSQPSLVAFMVDQLSLEPGMKVLSIGTGCGYHDAITSILIGESGKLYSFEFLPKLAEIARQNLTTQFGEDFSERIQLIEGDGSRGMPDLAPFDRIYLTAAPSRNTFNPRILGSQLREWGLLLYPDRRHPQHYGGDLVLMRQDGYLKEEARYSNVRFVALQGFNS